MDIIIMKMVFQNRRESLFIEHNNSRLVCLVLLMVLEL